MTSPVFRYLAGYNDGKTTRSRSTSTFDEAVEAAVEYACQFHRPAFILDGVAKGRWQVFEPTANSEAVVKMIVEPPWRFADGS